MTERYKPGERFASGVKLDPAPVFRGGVAGAKLEALPKPAPSQTVGSTLNVTPIADTRTPEQQATAALWDIDEQAEEPDDYAALREIQGRVDKPETIVQAVAEQRAYGEHNHPEKFTVVGLLRFRNEQLADSNARLTERLAEATVRAYEPPDTLTGVVGAAVEGLLATGKRWWRR